MAGAIRSQVCLLGAGLNALRRFSKVQTCIPLLASKRTPAVSRPLSLTSTHPTRQQQHTSRKYYESQIVKTSSENENCLQVEFRDGVRSEYPYVWLRDNCLCPKCFNKMALARLFLMENHNVQIKPAEVKVDNENLELQWPDGHQSSFGSSWLRKRSFDEQTQKMRRRATELKKVLWGAGYQPQEYAFDSLMKDDSSLLSFLVALEKNGAAFIHSCPDDAMCGNKLINHIAFMKRTHYGYNCTVIARPEVNNLAFTDAKLGLHVDLPFYEYMPGIIFLHMVKQAGTGGDSKISDGFCAADLIRRNHPDLFYVLTATDVYFWDKGVAFTDSEESDEFYKILKKPVIELDRKGEVARINYNNQVRDSYIDIAPSEGKLFYTALKLFEDSINENAVIKKLNSGEMFVLDNLRCMHGRLAFDSLAHRHLENIYLDWDEARCRRRRLQHKLEQFDIE